MRNPIARLAHGLSLPRLLIALLFGMLLSACSLPGTTSTPSQLTLPTATPGIIKDVLPLAGIPAAATKALQGKPVPTNETKSLVFNLAYNDSTMERDLTQIYTPGSAEYHHYLSASDIIQRYALSNQQLQQVTHWLTDNGYHVLTADPFRSSIRVEAPVSIINQSLHIQLMQYTLPVLNYTFYMEQGTPTLPHAIDALVQSILGLDNLAIPNIKLPIGFTTHATTQAGSNCLAYGAQQSLTRNKLAAAYQINQLYHQSIQGQQMTIGVAEFGDSYDPQDIANYAACVGIAAPSIENIDVDGHLASGPGQGEAAMDLELIAGLAPQAHIIDYQADINNTSFAQALVDVFNRVASDHRVQVLSVSYGTGEDMFSASEQVAVARSLRTLAAEGISVFISSGDCGAYSQRIHNLAVVSFPASAPYAIAVGGTHLQVSNALTRTSETAWGSDDGAPVCQNEWGSGGGVSQNSAFKRPHWQSGAGINSHYDGTLQAVLTPDLIPVSAPNGLRQVPDVAAAAYPNIAIYYQGAWLDAGGTSAAAPIWAAGTALVDQVLQQHQKALLGGVPEFYTLANRAGKFHPYNDITAGDNLFYHATRGWDYVTGWGSPNFANIAQFESQ